MNRLLTALTLVVALAAGAAPAGATPSIEFAGGGVVRGDLGPAVGDPWTAARTALERYQDRLGVDADGFVFESVRRSIVGVHVRGREYRGGIPVDRTSAGVHVVRGRVWQVEARGVGSIDGEPDEHPIGADAAVRAALAATGVTDPYAAPPARRFLVPMGGRLVDTWRVEVFSLRPAVAATVDVSAPDGRVLDIRDSRTFADGSATVFDPNPVVRLKKDLTQPGVDGAVDTDLDSADLTSALTTLPIREVNASLLPLGRLTGPWADVIGPAPLGLSPNFEFTRSDPRFEATMAYAHIDRLQRHIQKLGFTGAKAANAEPQTVITVPVYGFDNAFYQAGLDLLLFGNGGVDDAEDAEVVVHEYGHAVLDDQVPGLTGSAEGGAIHEGFGDFLAAAFYARISGGFQDTCVADWDATSYSTDDPPCLRRLDTAKRYPDDMVGRVHADGEIWSAFLWDVRQALGKKPKERTDRVLKLLLTSHSFLTDTAEFGDGVAALRTAAKALGQPKWASVVNSAATKRGLPLYPE